MRKPRLNAFVQSEWLKSVRFGNNWRMSKKKRLPIIALKLSVKTKSTLTISKRNQKSSKPLSYSALKNLTLKWMRRRPVSSSTSNLLMQAGKLIQRIYAILKALAQNPIKTVLLQSGPQILGQLITHSLSAQRWWLLSKQRKMPRMYIALSTRPNATLKVLHR